MDIQGINRTDAEKIFATYKNGEAYQLIPGTPVCVDFVTDSNGKTVKTPATGNTAFFAGCVAGRTIGTSGQPDQYGQIQVYGYHGGVRVNGLSAVAPGGMLGILAGSSTLRLGVSGVSTTDFNLLAAHVIAGTTLAESADLDTTMIAFIRAL